MAKYSRRHMHGKHSVARVYRGAPPDEKLLPVMPDTRTKAPGTGAQGEIECPGCGAVVRLVRAIFSCVETGVRGNDIVIPNHRPGGGRYSASRGDALCKRAQTLPDEGCTSLV